MQKGTTMGQPLLWARLWVWLLLFLYSSQQACHFIGKDIEAQRGKWLVQGQQLKHGLSEHLNPDQADSQVQCSRLLVPGYRKWEVGSQSPLVACSVAQQCCSQSQVAWIGTSSHCLLGGNTLGEECHWDAQQRHAVRSSRQQGEQGPDGHQWV